MSGLEALLSTSTGTGGAAPAALPGAVSQAVAAQHQACRCGHSKQGHQHYRRGTDCASCSCPRYSRSLVRRLVHRAG